ncbi:Uncharacterised protein [Mycobacteroides abscessus subsp. massiliense]|nr:Uncharacterised protein [Mycobacteroides abscessus subsp. massiliense]SKS18201.1 Uncharacterised protein [Mycobacteroides abscessus subsp. massiliense]SKV40845.1 Uncharacterised protein [Mycobacteroides abscessus subsp. massiliense]
MQRQHQIGEAEHDRRGVEQQHDRAVHGEQLVVLLIREELKPGMNQFSAHQQGHQPAHEEKAEAGDDVHHADQLVIGGTEQPVGESAAQTPRRKRALGRHRHEKLRLCAHRSSRRAVAARPWTRDRFRVLNMVATQQMRFVSTPDSRSFNGSPLTPGRARAFSLSPPRGTDGEPLEDKSPYPISTGSPYPVPTARKPF